MTYKLFGIGIGPAIQEKNADVNMVINSRIVKGRPIKLQKKRDRLGHQSKKETERNT